MNDFINTLKKDSDDIADSLSRLLLTEEIIKLKKENGIKLSDTELFFDNYLISPKFYLRILLRGLYDKKCKK